MGYAFSSTTLSTASAVSDAYAEGSVPASVARIRVRRPVRLPVVGAFKEGAGVAAGGGIRSVG